MDAAAGVLIEEPHEFLSGASSAPSRGESTRIAIVYDDLTNQNYFSR